MLLMSISFFFLDDTKEVIDMLYEKYLLSRNIKQYNDKISRLNVKVIFMA